MKAGIPLVLLSAVLLASCGPPPPKFGKAPDEQEKTLVRTIPYSYDAVWHGIIAVADSYHVHTLNREEGLVLTWWTKFVVQQTARFSEGRNFSHGIKIREHSDVPPSNGGEFEIQRRLRINVIADSESTTTINLALFYKVTPFEVYKDRGTRIGYKAYSIWEFDTREEFRLMDRIEHIAAATKKR